MMKGYPKNLNTMADYLYVKDAFPRVDWEKDFQALLDFESDWFFEKELSSAALGKNDDTHKVVEDIDFSGKKTYAQYVLRSNPQARIYRIGFTVEEVKAILG